MSASLLADLPRIVCGHVREVLPDLRRLAPHAGRFSLEELKSRGLPAPAVLVALLGARQDRTLYGPAHGWLCQMAGYVVTRDGLGAPRDAAAAVICQALLTLIPDQKWGLDALGAARGVALHTLVSEKTRDHAVSLWAVTWDQPVTFFMPAGAPPGVELYVAQEPETGAAHEDAYRKIGGTD